MKSKEEKLLQIKDINCSKIIAASLTRGINEVEVWKLFISRDDVSTEEKVKYGCEAKNFELLKFILAIPAVQKYLRKLTFEQILKRTNDEYLLLTLKDMNCDKSELIPVVRRLVQNENLNRSDKKEIWKILIGRNDVLIEEKIRFVKESRFSSLWSYIFELYTIKDFIKSLKSKKLIEFACEINSIELWRFIFENTGIRPEYVREKKSLSRYGIIKFIPTEKKFIQKNLFYA